MSRGGRKKGLDFIFSAHSSKASMETTLPMQNETRPFFSFLDAHSAKYTLPAKIKFDPAFRLGLIAEGVGIGGDSRGGSHGLAFALVGDVMVGDVMVGDVMVVKYE
jgi:hypothetical protein